MAGDVWADDLLDRKLDANFLAEFIRRNSKAIPHGTDKGLVLNVNSPWGGGKTFFAERFAAMLETERHRVAMVNAWRDDHAEDPMYAVMAAIITALGKSAKATAVRKEWVDTAKVVAAKAGIGAGKKLVSLVIGAEAAAGIADELANTISAAVTEAVDAVSAEALQRFEEGQKAISRFRAQLKSAIEQDEQPFVVLIDELDRCRPTYAISLLERIKHLFDVPNMVVVIATDTDQLAHTIRSVYGAGFAAERYLQRFFDHTYVFELPSMEQFVRQRWQTLGLEAYSYVPMGEYEPSAQVAIVAREFQLSLRATQRIIDIIANILSMRPQNEQDVQVPLIYIAILASYLVSGGLEYLAFYGAEPVGAPFLSEDEFTPRGTAFSLVQYDHSERGQAHLHASLLEIAGTFRSIAQSPLSRQINGKKLSDLYGEEYRRDELRKMHRNTWRGSDGPPSVTAQFSQRIRQAGRVRTGP